MLIFGFPGGSHAARNYVRVRVRGLERILRFVARPIRRIPGVYREHRPRGGTRASSRATFFTSFPLFIHSHHLPCHTRAVKRDVDNDNLNND